MDEIKVDNRRTLCEHCSLRSDLPGFISREHAEANRAQIESGDIFPCHMSHNPTSAKGHRQCLGAAKVAGLPLANEPAGVLPPVYEDLDEYVKTQAEGRKSAEWLLSHADEWVDWSGESWFGWWQKAPAGNWHYLMVTPEGNGQDSVYLFFDQCEQIYGPLELRKK